MTKRKRRQWCLFDRRNTTWQMTFSCDLVKEPTDDSYDESLPHVVEVFGDDPDIDELIAAARALLDAQENADLVSDIGKHIIDLRKALQPKELTNE